MLPVSAVLSAALAATVPAIAPSGEVVAPEGFRVQLPRGFTYATRAEDGRAVYAATSKPRDAAVSVTAIASDAGIDCEEAARSSEDVDVEAVATATGLEGCLIAGEAENGEGEMALALVDTGEGLVVVVNAVSTGPARASSVARTVARSIAPARRIARAPKVEAPTADERLVGCFERSQIFGTFDNGVSAATTLCLGDDFTFTKVLNVRTASTTYASGYGSDVTSEATGYGDAEASGTWTYEDGTLTLDHEDGGEVEMAIQLAEHGFVSRGAYWTRVR